MNERTTMPLSPVEKRLFDLEVQVERILNAIDRLESEIEWLKVNKEPRKWDSNKQRTRRR